MLAVQGPAGARARRGGSPTASCPRASTRATLHRRRRRRRARLRHRLHGRGRRRAARRARRAPAPSGTRSSRRGAAPAGLGARDTLRLEACFHLYGNDLSEDRDPIEAGLGWCCKEDTGFIGAEPIARRARAGHGREARPVRDHRPGHRAPGQPGARRRRRHLRHALADARLRHRHGLPAASSAPSPAPPFEIDVRGKTRAAEVRTKPLIPRSAELGRGQLPVRPLATTRSTTGPGSTATSPRSASPGTRRTSSARSSSSTRPRSARPCARATRTPRSSPSRPSPT